MNFANKAMIKYLNFYKKYISPSLGKNCRYTPTCSSYALSAFENRNFFIALFLSVKRVLRCNPLFKGGEDPVPKSKKQKMKDLELWTKHK